MAEIKSALELALEKAEAYGRASKEEMAAAQSQERGRLLAVEFLKGEGSLEADLHGMAPQEQPEARKAIKEVFLRNITLPRDEEADPRQERALAGLLLVSRDKKAMARLKADLEQLLQQFVQIRQSALQQLKARHAGGVTQMQRAMEAKTGQRLRLEVEHLPQFQEEWRQFQGQLLDKFEPALEQLKAQMLQA